MGRKPVIELKKPGKHKKKKNKMPPPPKEKHCRLLGYVTGTERWCHAESKIIKFQSGGGIMGSRIDHKHIAWLSFEADIKMSHALPKNSTQKQLKAHADQWEKLIDLSH